MILRTSKPVWSKYSQCMKNQEFLPLRRGASAAASTRRNTMLQDKQSCCNVQRTRSPSGVKTTCRFNAMEYFYHTGSGFRWLQNEGGRVERLPRAG
jgi:hypothetical protein